MIGIQRYFKVCSMHKKNWKIIFEQVGNLLENPMLF